MKKSDMITITVRECWKQWAHLEALKLEIAIDAGLSHPTYEDLHKLIEADATYQAALSVWYGMSELADKIGIDWLNLGYHTSDIETIDARESHTRDSIHFWRLCKNPA